VHIGARVRALTGPNDVVVRSFPASQHDGKTVTCAPSGAGTHVEWVSRYTLPARGGGKVIELITAR
jgi:hypothetical protein